jgi:hypothetical protein
MDCDAGYKNSVRSRFSKYLRIFAPLRSSLTKCINYVDIQHVLHLMLTALVSLPLQAQAVSAGAAVRLISHNQSSKNGGGGRHAVDVRFINVRHVRKRRAKSQHGGGCGGRRCVVFDFCTSHNVYYVKLNTNVATRSTRLVVFMTTDTWFEISGHMMGISNYFHCSTPNLYEHQYLVYTISNFGSPRTIFMVSKLTVITR